MKLNEKYPLDIEANRVVGEDDAAGLIDLSGSSLRRLRRAGAGPRYVRLSPRRIGYRIGDLIAWLEARASPRQETVVATRRARATR